MVRINMQMKRAPSVQLKDSIFCAVDVETTGLDIDRDEIIAFACLPIRHTKIIVHEAYYTLIKSERYRIESMKYHGISESDLENTPLFGEVAREIIERMNGVLIGHSVGFDYGVLRKHFKKAGIRLKRDTVDIAAIEKWLAENTGRPAPDLTLEGIMRKYGLKGHYRHNAFADAFFAAQIFQFELLELSRLGIETVEELVRIVKSASKSFDDLAFW